MNESLYFYNHLKKIFFSVRHFIMRKFSLSISQIIEETALSGLDKFSFFSNFHRYFFLKPETLEKQKTIVGTFVFWTVVTFSLPEMRCQIDRCPASC